MPAKKHLHKKSFLIKGHATSVALEDDFWEILQEIAHSSNKSLNELITNVDATRNPNHPLTSALRLTALHSLSKDTV